MSGGATGRSPNRGQNHPYHSRSTRRSLQNQHPSSAAAVLMDFSVTPSSVSAGGADYHRNMEDSNSNSNSNSTTRNNDHDHDDHHRFEQEIIYDLASNNSTDNSRNNVNMGEGLHLDHLDGSREVPYHNRNSLGSAVAMATANASATTGNADVGSVGAGIAASYDPLMFIGQLHHQQIEERSRQQQLEFISPPIRHQQRQQHIIGISPRETTATSNTQLFHQYHHPLPSTTSGGGGGRSSIGSISSAGSSGTITMPYASGVGGGGHKHEQRRSNHHAMNKLLFRGSTPPAASIVMQQQQQQKKGLKPRKNFYQQHQQSLYHANDNGDVDDGGHANQHHEDDNGDDDGGGVLANSIPPPTEPKPSCKKTKLQINTTTAIPTTTVDGKDDKDKNNKDEEEASEQQLNSSNHKNAHHSMPLTSIQKLRKLAQSTLTSSSSTFTQKSSNAFMYMTGLNASSSNHNNGTYASSSFLPQSSSSSSFYSTNASSTAVFYTSILHTKTKSIYDAYLYAKALCYNDEYKRAIGILDLAGLLSFDIVHDLKHSNNNEYHGDNDNILSVRDENDNGRDGNKNDNHKVPTINTTTTSTTLEEILLLQHKQRIRLVMESVILACYCWSYSGEWEQVGSLLEHFILNNPIIHDFDHDYHYHDNQNQPQQQNQSRRINDYHGAHEFIHSPYHKEDFDIEDEEIFCRLAHYIHDLIDHDNEINPISRLCFLCGQACDEGNNPHRAVTFLKLALWIDVKCIEAWQYLCKRRLLTWEQEREVVYSLRFDRAGEGVEWLRDVYLASMTSGGSMTKNVTAHTSQRNRSGKQQFYGPECTPVASSLVGASPIIPVLPEQPTPQMNINRSAINFEPSPLTSHSTLKGEPFTGKSGDHSKFNLKPSPITSKFGQSVTFRDEDEAFHNLNSKHDLSTSPEILTMAATRAYNSYNLPLSLHYCHMLHEIDPLCSKAAHVQIATLTGLGHKRPLFRLAHVLVDADPKSAMAWYAVGCYYYTCGRFDVAQRHFSRSIRLDDRIAECWVAYGCAFASCDENDQANTCFRHAQRLYSGSHYPMLYMGMEHLRTNNIPLAGHFLNSARNMGKSDPLCCNELGVWAYRKKGWNEAANWFVLALRLHIENEVKGEKLSLWDKTEEDEDLNESRKFASQQLTASLSDNDCVEFCEEEFWEPTIFNLGQSYRKARRFRDASICFEKCLALCPVSVTLRTLLLNPPFLC